MSPDVVVIGGGAIGLASAWRLAQAGCSVTVCDPAPGSQATHASAGMLAPVTEAHYGEDRLLRLNLAAAERWAGFAEELEAESGLPVGYRTCGSLVVALDSDDARVLEDLAGYLARLDLEAELLSGSASREVEPALAPGVRRGLRVVGDHQADNRLLAEALLGALARRGVQVVRHRVTRVDVVEGQVEGVTLDDGSTLPAEQVLLAAGCWSGQLGGVPPDALPPVRPVKGQILRIQGPADDPVLRGNVRGLVRGRSLYLVPRASGRIVVGATVEEMGFDTTVTVDGIHRLLHDAAVLVPGLLDLELAETTAGLRPGSPDNEPVVGRTTVGGLVVATGHHRNGILLAPVTADAVAGLLGGGPEVPEIDGFGPERFRTGAAA
ncbi:MAG TPA: glycine oxidase ThiO [Acidimicrobiales bacterium]|nr:glycine oxidase ThiO [Acidimicrobiales bacterium]